MSRNWVGRWLGGSLALVTAFLLALAPSASASEASMVQDIYPGGGWSWAFFPTPYLDPGAATGDVAYFSADDGVHGQELWRSDGTAGGTELVRDIRPGDGSSRVSRITNVGGTIFFRAGDGVHGRELWRSDGTAGGTELVRDIRPGNPVWGGSKVTELTNVHGTLFFAAQDANHGLELWRSDGTAAGTKMVRDIWPGSGESRPHDLTEVGGRLMFMADDGTHGDELWRSDGTAAGTRMVRDIYPGTGGAGIETGGLQSLTAIDGTLFFNARDAKHGAELWRSDGTFGGTRMVKNIAAGATGSLPLKLTAVGGTLFFNADDGVHGNELWRSDGTASGTRMVRDICPDPPSCGSYPDDLAKVGGRLFFSAFDDAHGVELWRSDGTSGGTKMVRDIKTGEQSSNVDSLTNVAGTAFLTASDGIHGQELWSSDGTAAGTELVRDVSPHSVDASGGPGPQGLTSLGGTLYFGDNDGIHGFELWKAVP